MKTLISYIYFTFLPTVFLSFLLLQVQKVMGQTNTRWHHFLISRSVQAIDGRTSIVDVVNGKTKAPAIHVIVGDELAVNVTNNLPDHGISIHWHGFEMRGYNVFDGVIGVTQCAIAPGESFLYRFIVDEIPGTYWWHTHSDEDPVAQDLVRGPLIVHPRDIEQQQQDSAVPNGYSYLNERIIFCKIYS